MKSVRIVPQLASDAVRWHENKYAQQQHNFLFASHDLKIEIIRLFFHLEDWNVQQLRKFSSLVKICRKFENDSFSKYVVFFEL